MAGELRLGLFNPEDTFNVKGKLFIRQEQIRTSMVVTTWGSGPVLTLYDDEVFHVPTAAYDLLHEGGRKTKRDAKLLKLDLGLPSINVWVDPTNLGMELEKNPDGTLRLIMHLLTTRLSTLQEDEKRLQVRITVTELGKLTITYKDLIDTFSRVRHVLSGPGFKHAGLVKII